LALAEVVLVYVILKTLVKAYYATPLSGREFDVLHWPYSVQLLSLGVAVAMIAAFGRPWRAYGLVPNWRQDLRLGGGLALLFIAVPMVAMAVFGGLEPEPSGPGAVISTIIFQFFLSGLGEEIVYRGYIQSRLNRAFGRPLKVGPIRFGAGLLITALLFGLSHSLSGFNPFVGSFRFDLFYGLVTGIWGLLYGLLRERTGSVLGAGILHGHEAVIENFVVTPPGQIAYGICLLISFVVLLGAPALRRMLGAEPEPAIL
jgi:hypothetical protein